MPTAVVTVVIVVTVVTMFFDTGHSCRGDQGDACPPPRQAFRCECRAAAGLRDAFCIVTEAGERSLQVGWLCLFFTVITSNLSDLFHITKLQTTTDCCRPCLPSVTVSTIRVCRPCPPSVTWLPLQVELEGRGAAQRRAMKFRRAERVTGAVRDGFRSHRRFQHRRIAASKIVPS